MMNNSIWRGGKGIVAGGVLAAAVLPVGAAADATTSQRLRDARSLENVT